MAQVPSVLVCESVPLLQSQLVEMGVPHTDIEFRSNEEWDRFENASSHPKGHDDSCSEEKKDFGESAHSRYDLVDIKTLVWELSFDSQKYEFVENENCSKVHEKYFVTALRMEDKVDEILLRDLVYQYQNLPPGCTTPSTLSISMAPQEIAESLTGFQSGCIPPICHSKPMKLYMDASIPSQSKNDEERLLASMGSGILGHSLLLPMKQFLNVAEKANNHGIRVGAFIQRSSSSRTKTPTTTSPDKESKVKNKQERGPSEPKDRVAEYRSFKSFVDKAKLLRTTARKKGRVEQMKKLVEEAVATGDFPDVLTVSPNHGQGKNALHLSAWRGDFETVQLLVEANQKSFPELDLVNMISEGPGNYGKTPIFYALTQCREDVARYLVSQGADLLIVNNKGQTPCSTAASHLQEEACQFLYDIEKQQLEAGGTFVNYRSTHPSNERSYGDLDPRFPIDPANMGEDLKEALLQYPNSISATCNGIPTQFSPRSLRPTVRWWKKYYHASQTAAGEVILPQSSQRKSIDEMEEMDEMLPRKDPSPETKDWVFENEVTLSSLELLTVEQVLDPACQKKSEDHSIVLVNCTNSIRSLESEVDHSARCYSNPENSKNGSKMSYDFLVNSSWGLDCEWKPGFECGKDNPVATLQLSTRRRSFLIDLQTICQPSYEPGGKNNEKTRYECTPLEKQLSKVVEKLFRNRGIPILGYCILQDLGKLSASFPHMSCFSKYHSVMDLQSVSSILYPKASRRALASLQKMVAVLLHKRLDKTQQCSDWSKRPLSHQQIQYAALDAAVLPLLLKTMMEQSSTTEKDSGNFFSTHAKDLRFTFLDEGPGDDEAACQPEEDSGGDKEFTYDVPMGSVKCFLSRKIARQRWPSTDDVPDLPKRVPILRSETDVPKVSKKERAHLLKVGGHEDKKKRPKTVQLKGLALNLNDLPVPGILLGYTKDSCVERALGSELMCSLPEQTRIGFYRKSSVVESSNAWIIFCNFRGTSDTTQELERSPPIEFSKDARSLRFSINPRKQNGKSSDGTLLEFVLQKKAGMLVSDKKVLLFARDSTRSKYMYSGLCECQDVFPRECGTVDLLLHLIDFDELVRKNSVSQNFLEHVEAREAGFIRS